ncbi:MAG: PEGA domain-containing protein [Myxococcota bacterium]
MLPAATPLLLLAGVHLDGSLPDPIEILLVTPTGEGGRVSRSETIRALEDRLAEHTLLEPVLIDPTVNEDCRGRLACIVRSLGRRDDPTSKWLLVVTHITLEGEPDRVSLTLLDRVRAARQVGRAGAAEAEVRVDEAADRTSPVQVRDLDGLRSLLDRTFRVDFRSAWSESGHLPPRGSIVISGASKGALIDLDGRSLGTGDGQVVVIDRVRPGRHRVRVTAPGHPGLEQEVSVPSNGATEVLVPWPQSSHARLRTGLTVASGVLAAAGVGLLVTAAVTREDVRTACFDETPGCRGGSSFVGFGYDPDALQASEVDDGGMGWVPIGAALSGAGLALAVGTLLEEEERPPWWSMLGAVVVGGAAFGLAVGLDQARTP